MRVKRRNMTLQWFLFNSRHQKYMCLQWIYGLQWINTACFRSTNVWWDERGEHFHKELQEEHPTQADWLFVPESRKSSDWLGLGSSNTTWPNLTPWGSYYSGRNLLRQEAASQAEAKVQEGGALFTSQPEFFKRQCQRKPEGWRDCVWWRFCDN